MSGIIHVAPDEYRRIPLNHPPMPPPHHFPVEHITTPVNHFQQMYTPPEAFARDQVYPPPGYPGASLIPQYTPQPQPVAGPSFAPAPFPPQHQHQPNGPSSRFQVGYPPDGEWQGQADWDEDGYQDGQDIIYGNLEVSLEHAASVPPPQVSDKNPTSKVKHRRRTTPEQLMVLEHWFDINPKPDNNLREWLAADLGMSKRNVQVWFQNRRAKVKGLAIKEKLAAERTASDAEALETGKTPERQTVLSHSPPPIHQKTSPPHQQVLLPPVNTANMGRRLSLANGEAAKIDTWVAKRMAADAGQGRPSGHVSPVRSPLMGQAAAARRNSIPYPSPIPEGQQLRPPNGMSPKISPSIRPMPSVLHLTAIRNNSRRASMPGAAQLISSGPFTPPRVSSGMYPMGIGRPNRRLTPIKDHDGEAHSQSGLVFGDADLSTTYLTPPSSTYRPSNTSPTSYLPPDSGSMMYDYPLDPSQQSPFTPNAPLPNPTFSFGSGAMQRHSISFTEDQSPYMAMRQRARIGSMASITASTTDGGMENGSDFGQDWMGPSGMDRFDPDARRASAPADLLHHLGILGINTNLPLQTSEPPLRPSPLGSGFISDTSDQSAPYPFHDPTTFAPSTSDPSYSDHQAPHSDIFHSNSTSEHSPLSSNASGGPSPLHLGIPPSQSSGHSPTLVSPLPPNPSHHHSQILAPEPQYATGNPFDISSEGEGDENKDESTFFPDLRDGSVHVLA